MGRLITRELLIGIANEILRTEDPDGPTLEPASEFAVYQWHGSLDRLHDQGKIADEEYLALSDLFSASFYPVPMKSMTFAV